MTYFENEIITVKVATGEEVIARHIKTLDNGTLQVKQPVTLAQTKDGLTLVPFSICGNLDKITEIPASAIMLYALAKDEIASKYEEATSSLVLPQKKSIIMG